MPTAGPWSHTRVHPATGPRDQLARIGFPPPSFITEMSELVKLSFEQDELVLALFLLSPRLVPPLAQVAISVKLFTLRAAGRLQQVSDLGFC